MGQHLYNSARALFAAHGTRNEKIGEHTKKK